MIKYYIDIPGDMMTSYRNQASYTWRRNWTEHADYVIQQGNTHKTIRIEHSIV